jgi:SAM-dependent methyltransferase
MNAMKNINAFYETALGADVRKTLLRAVKSCGLRTGYDVRTLLVGAPDAYAVAIAEICLGTVSIAYNETDTPPQPLPELPRADVQSLSHNTLPFGDFVFDQVIILHALEFSPAPVRLMREAQRVLASDGRVIAIASNRLGMWSWFASTPFGEGITISISQMRKVLTEAELSPVRVHSILFFPPLNIASALAEAIESIGQYLGLGIGGVVVASALKQRYAGTGIKSKPPVDVKPSLQWVPARATHKI